jgi:hypothetical protein
MTKEIIHLMKVLGHNNIKNTLVCAQLVNFNDEDYSSEAAWTMDEVCKLVEAGFQYVCDFENARAISKSLSLQEGDVNTTA